MIDGVPQAFIGGIAFEHDSINSRLGGTMKNTQITLFRVDVTKNSTARAAPPAPEKFSRDWLVGPDGGIAATFDQNNETGNWSIHSGAGTRLASGTAPFGNVRLHFLGRNADSVVYGVENDEGSYDYFEVPLAGGTAIPFLPDQPFDAAFVDDRTGAVIGTLPTAANAHARFFDPARQAVADKIVRAFGKFYIELSAWNRDFSKVLVHTSGNGDSGTWYFVDVASLRAQPVGYERVNILPEQVGPISTVAYKAADGMEMDGILTLPAAREARKLPVIVLPHGGPASYDTPAFDWWAQAFASRGYAVFQPNFRGSTNRDATFQRAGDGQWGRKMQTDISDGLAELVRRGLVDPARACIVGASYGGYAALAGVTLQHGLYRCAVSVAGVSDLSRRFNLLFEESGYNPLEAQILERQMGERSRLETVSPRHFAATADAPILLIHGKDDTVVPFSQSTDMADALKAAGKPYEMTVLRHEDHWLSSADTRTQMLQAAMAFVQKYNPAD